MLHLLTKSHTHRFYIVTPEPDDLIRHSAGVHYLMIKVVYTLTEPETNWFYKPHDLNSASIRLTDECLVALEQSTDRLKFRQQ